MFTARSDLKLYIQLKFRLVFEGLFRLKKKRLSNYMQCEIDVNMFAKL